MSIMYKKVFQHVENENGHRQTSFSIVKDKNGVIHKINGVGNGNVFNIKETVAKNLTGNRSKYAIQQRVYKLKSSNIKNLLGESRNSIKQKQVSTLQKINTLQKVNTLQKDVKDNLKDKIKISSSKKSISKKDDKKKIKKSSSKKSSSKKTMKKVKSTKSIYKNDNK